MNIYIILIKGWTEKILYYKKYNIMIYTGPQSYTGMENHSVSFQKSLVEKQLECTALVQG